MLLLEGKEREVRMGWKGKDSIVRLAKVELWCLLDFMVV